MTKILTINTFLQSRHTVFFKSMIREGTTLYKSSIQYEFINNLYYEYKKNEITLEALNSWVSHINEMKLRPVKNGSDTSNEFIFVDAIDIFSASKKALNLLEQSYKNGYMNSYNFNNNKNYAVDIKGYSIMLNCNIGSHCKKTLEKVKKAESIEEQIQYIEDDIIETKKLNEKLLNQKHSINSTAVNLTIQKFSEVKDEWIEIHQIELPQLKEFIKNDIEYIFEMPDDISEDSLKILKESDELAQFIQDELVEVIKTKATGHNKLLLKKILGIFRPVKF